MIMETICIRRWQEFREYVDNDRAIMPVYWRGQADPGWPLASSFERLILNLFGGWREGASKVYPYDGRYNRDGKPLWEAGFYHTMRDRYLTAFKQATSGLRGPNPKNLETDEEWWALGRHYGLITPLLDWTEKPYIAAFFALTSRWSDMNKASGVIFSGKEVALYRLFHNEQLEGDGLRVMRPKVEELGRMHGQRGLFTWLDSETYFELQGFLDNTNRGNLLTRILISDQAVTDGLKDLAAHGIDYRMLFPDMVGAALHANMQFDNPL